MPDHIRILSDAATAGDREAIVELALIARRAPQTKRTAGVEYRVLPARFELKASGRRIIGYGSTFESPENYDSHGDIIRPGAFAGSLAKHKAEGTSVVMHDAHLETIGVWDVVEEDVEGAKGKRGLYVEGDVLDTTSGEDALKLVKAGIYRGLSIGYYTRAERYLDGYEGRPLVLTKWGYPVRELLEVELVEVSVLASGSNPYAEVLEVRAARRELKHAAPPPAYDPDVILRRVHLTVAAIAANNQARA